MISNTTEQAHPMYYIMFGVHTWMTTNELEAARFASTFGFRMSIGESVNFQVDKITVI